MVIKYPDASKTDFDSPEFWMFRKFYSSIQFL